MIRNTLRALGLCAAATFAATASASAQQMTEVNFGIISTESTQNLKTVWEPFLADMEKKIGMKVNAFFAPDYAGVIQAQRFKKVDLAWYGNKAAIEAVDRADGEVFVQSVAANGDPGYWSLLLVNKDHELAQMEPAKSQGGGANFDPTTYKGCEPCMKMFFDKMSTYTFGNGDPNSTSGFLVPGYYIFSQKNLDPKQAFKRMVTANHETNALAAANKQVDVSTNNTENLARMKLNFPEKYNEVRAIWISPLIASDPIVWRKDLPADAKAKLKNFFLTYGTGATAEPEKKILAGLQWAPFKESSNKQLIPFRQLDLAAQKTKIEGSTMSAAEKAKDIAEIDTKLAALNKEAMTN
jgi:phosphonate transport system substrate-binding protein